MDSRTQIERIKKQFLESLEKRSGKFNRAILRELDFLFRKSGSKDLSAFLDSVQKYFDIPAAERAAVISSVKESQRQIAELWAEYFAGGEDLFDGVDPNLFEKMQALYKVDFTKIKSDAGEIITKEIRRSVRAGKGYEDLRMRLLQRSLGEAQSRTLAVTALAQFDNAMMFEYAQQGGVQKFKYDGVLHTNTRPFCREHLGKQYTLEQIRKMDNGQGIPVETGCGGYNCTHFWTPVVTEVPKKAPRKKKRIDSSTAIGTPVSQALDIRVRGELKKIIDRSIAFIDSVHGDGQLKMLPITNMRGGSEYGKFRYFSSSREAVDIQIRENTPHVEMTTIHEIGHYLDHSGIGVRKVMSSTSDPMMDDWRKAVEASTAYQKLKSVYDRGYIEVERFGIKEKVSSPKVRSHFSYLLSDEELWARSYAQYIAVKTKNPTLLKQLEQMRSDPIEGESQWSDAEFSAIEIEIDNLFTKLGWIQ